jgi:hypothetical protein
MTKRKERWVLMLDTVSTLTAPKAKFRDALGPFCSEEKARDFAMKYCAVHRVDHAFMRVLQLRPARFLQETVEVYLLRSGKIL